MSNAVHLLQISDSHLQADPQGTLRGVRPLDCLLRLLAHTRRHTGDANAIVCSGDIVNDEPEGYQHFAEALGGLGTPVFCLPGNHDQPDLLKAALSQRPFQVGGHADLGRWRIVLLDSCVPGRDSGRLGVAELQRLRRAIAETDRFIMACVHHHPVEIGSAWLDRLGLENAEELLTILDECPRARVLSWGHVHQAFDTQRGHLRLLGTPSTCAQFKPESAGFGLDERPPGYRQLTLHADGSVDTEVIWVEAARARASETALPTRLAGVAPRTAMAPLPRRAPESY